MSRKNILLIGLGPHAKRIYIKGLRAFGQLPLLIVELESQRQAVEAYLIEQKISAKIYFVPTEEKDREVLSPRTCADLDRLLQTDRITHAILSTEPKAHYAYLQYLITRKIPTLADKPITAPTHVCNKEQNALLIRKQYQHLLQLQERYGTPVTVQCQRRYDRRYQWIRSVVSDLMKQYEIPIHHMQVYHSDGALYTPDEMVERENHPYKYGYGKLFHSGYHFLDLLPMMLSFETLPVHKRPTSFQLFSTNYSPADQLFSMDEAFYGKVFHEKSYREPFDELRAGRFRTMGELDFMANLQFVRDQKTLTTCSLNLLSAGFSRRGWSKQALDTYKNNGRVRHESICLTMGPLLTIQVHSYQSCEVKDRDNPYYKHDAVGGLDHYQIYIFRNVGIIGGKPCEVIEGKDLFSAAMREHASFIGYNEAARDECLKEFLEGTKPKSSLADQKLTIDILTSAYLSIAKKRNGQIPFVECQIEPFSNEAPVEELMQAKRR